MDQFSNVSAKLNVAILLATYNGARFIRAQLDSLLLQTHADTTIYISDDGSTDGTLEIINSYRSGLLEGRIVLFQGPRRGAAQNFIRLITNQLIESDYFFLCDQDDIWLKNKISTYLYRVLAHQDKPVLVGGRSYLYQGKGSLIIHTPRKICVDTITFENSLLECFTSGNTMMFNAAFRNELLSERFDLSHVLSHDWFLYQYATLKNFHVVDIHDPLTLYRQHSVNLLGSPVLLKNRFRRLLLLVKGDWRRVMLGNTEALLGVVHCPIQNLRLLEEFSTIIRARARLTRTLGLLGLTRVRRTSLLGSFIMKILL